MLKGAQEQRVDVRSQNP